MRKIESWKVFIFILGFVILAWIINTKRTLSSSSSSFVQQMAAQQPLTVHASNIVTNIAHVNQTGWTKIPCTPGTTTVWNVVEQDFGLDMLMNGKLYRHPPRNDPAWTDFGDVSPLTSLSLRVTPGASRQNGSVLITVTYNNGAVAPPPITLEPTPAPVEWPVGFTPVREVVLPDLSLIDPTIPHQRIKQTETILIGEDINFTFRGAWRFSISFDCDGSLFDMAYNDTVRHLGDPDMTESINRVRLRSEKLEVIHATFILIKTDEP